MKLVILESPYAGDVESNMKYLADCMRDCLLNHNESPYASHGLYPLCLDDNDPDERLIGINAGLEWSSVVDKVVVYTDKGVSAGMKLGINQHKKNGKHIVYRSIF